MLLVLLTLALPGTCLAAQEAKADPALDLYFGANGLYNRQLYPVAAQQYRQFLQKFPRHAKADQARLGLGMSLYAMGAHAEAVPILQELLKNSNRPEHGQVCLMLGQSLLQTGKAAEAESLFRQALKKGKDEAGRTRAEAGLCETLYQQKKWADLSKVGEGLSRTQGPLGERVRFQRGMALVELKEYPGAIQTLAPFSEGSTSSAFAPYGQFLLAESYRHSGDLTRAEASYRMVAEGADGPYKVDAAYLLGFVEFSGERHAEAIRDLSNFLKNNAAHAQAPRAHILLGRSYLAQEDYPNAVKALTQAAKTEALKEEAGLWLGRAYTRQNKPEQAEQILSQTASGMKGPVFAPLILLDLGRVKMQREQFGPAAEIYQRFIREHARHEKVADAMRQRAYCLHRAGQYPEAVQQSDAFLNQFPKDALADEAAFIKAESQYLGGQPDAAAASFAAGMVKYPLSPRQTLARYRAGQIAYEQKAWQKSLDLITPLLQKPPAEAGMEQLKFIAGVCAYQLERWPAATQHLEAFIKDQPRAPNVDLAHLTAGLAYEKAGDTANAVRNLARLPAAFPSSPHLDQARVELGRLQYAAKQYPAARTTLEPVTPKSSFRTAAAYYLGWIAHEEKKFGTAMAHFAAAADADATHPLAEDARFQQGLNALAAENYSAAQQAFERYLQDYPAAARRDRVLLQLGLALARQEAWGPAADRLAELARSFPKSTLRPRALYDAAWAEKGRKQPDAAMKQYRDLLTAYPGHELAPAAGFELAELEYAAGQPEPAAARLDQVLTASRDPALRERALYRLGWCRFDAGQYAAAAKAFEQLLQEVPASELAASAAFQAGEARLKLKEFAAAETWYARAVALERKNKLSEQSLLRLGEIQGLMKQWNASQKTFQEFIQVFPQSELLRRARYGLGWAQENQQQYDAAIRTYTEVIARGVKDETEARCQFQVGECYLALKKYNEALAELVKVEVNYAYPEYSSKALLEMGNILKLQGEPEAATARYREVVEKYADTDAARVAGTLIK